jgi:hypothetical protein
VKRREGKRSQREERDGKERGKSQERREKRKEKEQRHERERFVMVTSSLGTLASSPSVDDRNSRKTTSSRHLNLTLTLIAVYKSTAPSFDNSERQTPPRESLCSLALMTFSIS